MSDDWLDLLTSPLEVARATEFVSVPKAGGIDIFLGTTRAELSASGHELIALDYQAYDSMARRQLKDLADGARQKWPVLRLAILHRLGRVLVGEASVLIAVSTPHRAESFEACRWIIDQLKKDVTIWKQEIWAGGQATWVHADTNQK
jgi:molybdopterin synthase catalytic subunit